MFESPEAEGSDLQSTSDRQASVSRQKQDHGSGAVSSRTCKQMTYSLTDGQRGMAKKQKKAKSRKPRGIKTMVSEGTEPRSVSSIGNGRSAASLLPEPVRKPEAVSLPDDPFESDDSEDENAGGAPLLSCSPMESKSDQLAPQMVPPPKESLIPGDVTSLVTNAAVTSQDCSPVHDSACPSSSTPVKQEGTVAQPFEVSANVYVVMGHECGAVNTSRGQTQVPSRMSLGTQVDSDLSFTEGSSLALTQATDDNPGSCLQIDLAKPIAEIASQVRAQLQLAQSHTLGGARVTPISDEDLVMFGQWMDKVGLENLPQVQPKQVLCTGVRALVQTLEGAQIHLVH